MEQAGIGIGLDIDRMLAGEHGGDALIGRGAIVDDQDAAVPSHLGDRFALRALDADVARRQRAHAQLVGHQFEARKRTHARDQRHVGDRLGEEIVGPGLEAAHPIGRLVERGDHHHRDVVRRQPGLEAAADLEAVHVRHHHVEQHDVALRALADRERLRAAHGGEDVEIFGGEPRLQQLDVGRHVVDDENAGGHRPRLLRLCQESGGWSR